MSLKYESFPKKTDIYSSPYIEEEEEEEVSAQVEATIFSLAETPMGHFIPSSSSAWMPDHLCSVCFECEQPFTFLSRRHHCRICGNVFCNTCTSFYINESLFRTLTFSGKLSDLENANVRSCKACSSKLADHAEAERSAILNILASSDARELNGYGTTPYSSFGFNNSNDTVRTSNINIIKQR
jgi:hypothetical protein